MLNEIKKLAAEGGRRLAEIRNKKRESRPSRKPTPIMRELRIFRKHNKKKPSEKERLIAELTKVNTFLDLDTITMNERRSLKTRRRYLMQRLGYTGVR